ncbi:hypothetical protein ASD38_13600 [Caulobacter sp. Root487D2Y]|uniref:RcnB family protein n=1 Tax=Caulobacter sp. Root487D2Y TaxID=1736547 RepID=UPI0006F37165|nr:RcnB family protein [Caulobacter sp. Root487D2Y]KQY30301.1 hypothetical protein ASD38_13600 [Caulobacter sp. Root487D2Y]
MKTFLTAAAALSIVASAGVAGAQPQPQSHGNQGPGNQGPGNQGPGNQGHDNPGRDNQRPKDQGRHDNGRHEGPGDHYSYERHATKHYKAPGRYHPPHGYHARQWHRGDTLPASYRSRAYVVDYRHYGLGAPPHGYQYVRVNNDVVLTAIATGVIAAVIYQLFQ